MSEHASADGPPGPALDAQAKDAYRRRLEELGEELEEARGWGDPERAARTEAEIDALTEQLAQAFGLGGRDRAGASPAERARVSVTKAIRSAIKTIERHSPALGEHLDRFDPHRPVLLVRTAGRAAAALAPLNARVDVGGTSVPRVVTPEGCRIANEERNA